MIVHDPTRRRFTLLVRMLLWIADANDYMRLSTFDGHGVAADDPQRHRIDRQQA